ncbi:MAG: MarR family transcriptional regulator [Acidimicrobiales bacterium]
MPFEFTPRLRLAVARLTRMLRQLADPEAGMSQGLISALATVSRHGTITLGALAEQERVQPPSMTKIVARLEERGMLVRQVDGRDRRVIQVQTTTDGNAFLERMRTRRNEFLAARLAELSADEREALERALPAMERLAGLS